MATDERTEMNELKKLFTDTPGFYIVPARVTTTDTGIVVNRKPAVLHRNDGLAEGEWKFRTTAEAQEEAEFIFGVDVERWDADDLATLWPVVKKGAE